MIGHSEAKHYNKTIFFLSLLLLRIVLSPVDNEAFDMGDREKSQT